MKTNLRLVGVVALVVLALLASGIVIFGPRTSEAIILPSMTWVPHEDITVERVVHEPENMRLYRIYDKHTGVVCYHSIHGIDCLSGQ